MPELNEYRFSFGPWNIHEGEDPFGPPRSRNSYSFDEKISFYRDLGFALVFSFMTMTLYLTLMTRRMSKSYSKPETLNNSLRVWA